jgi:hypothetical protein
LTTPTAVTTFNYVTLTKDKIMKKLILYVVVSIFASFAFAGDDTYEIERDGSEIQMKQRYNYDSSDRYRRTIENDGSIRMRDYNG